MGYADGECMVCDINGIGCLQCDYMNCCNECFYNMISDHDMNARHKRVYKERKKNASYYSECDFCGEEKNVIGLPICDNHDDDHNQESDDDLMIFRDITEMTIEEKENEIERLNQRIIELKESLK